MLDAAPVEALFVANAKSYPPLFPIQVLHPSQPSAIFKVIHHLQILHKHLPTHEVTGLRNVQSWSSVEKCGTPEGREGMADKMVERMIKGLPRHGEAISCIGSQRGGIFR